VSKKCNHAVPSNTHECFESFIGHTIKGLLFHALPLGRRDLSCGSKTFVFECGHGLTIGDNGSFWADSPQDITRAIEIVRDKLNQSQRNLKDVLALAGEV
jgi:hypothetical protein